MQLAYVYFVFLKNAYNDHKFKLQPIFNIRDWRKDLPSSMKIFKYRKYTRGVVVKDL